MNDVTRSDLQMHGYDVTMAINSLVTAMGMQAENQQREYEGKAPAYTEADFQQVLNDNGTHHNSQIGRWIY